ncbi:hypothetical protein EDB85DRAFT_333885 [Lactarius pseudohatsudake]|nr:hypothetical protein EDB85DRAFT_333885 [Lactarius pseudohatsudake]
MFLFIFTQHTHYDSVLEISLVGPPRSSPPSRSSRTWWTTRVASRTTPQLLPPQQPLRPRLLAAPRSHPRAPPAHPGVRDRPHPAPQPLKVGPPPHHLRRPLHFPLYRSREKTRPLPLPCLRHLVIDLCNLFDDARTRATGPPLRITVCSRAKTLTRVNRRLVALGDASGPGGSRPQRKVRILPRVSALRMPVRLRGGRSDVQRNRICRSAVPRGGRRADVSVSVA